MTNAVLNYAGYIAFAVAPAVCTAVMMLVGRFSGERGFAFFGAFVLWLGLGGALAMIYFMLPVPHMFGDDLGILGMPGFQWFSASTLFGVFTGAVVVTYEDLRPLWSEDQPEPAPDETVRQ